MLGQKLWTHIQSVRNGTDEKLICGLFLLEHQVYIFFFYHVDNCIPEVHALDQQQGTAAQKKTSRLGELLGY